jgi:energy-converting hydrogenase Eha subunit G
MQPKLTAQERYLVHQVHPVKLATDVSASIASDVLFWRHRLVPGIVVMLVPSVAVSTVLLRSDLEVYRESAAGHYVLLHMPPSMQLLRAVSAVVTAVGAWRKSRVLVGIGYALTLLGWSHGLLTPSITR